jgi:hypothetical protein
MNIHDLEKNKTKYSYECGQDKRSVGIKTKIFTLPSYLPPRIVRYSSKITGMKQNSV